MPRYIDVDNFRKTMIKRFGCVPCLTDYSDTARYDIPIDDALELEPTADVVPRSEVESLQEEIENLESMQEISPEAKYLVDTKADNIISLLTEITKSQEQIKAEARKEFAEEIKEILAPTVSTLFYISETLVEVSKQHISPEEALKNIRVQLSEKQPICSKLQLEEVLDKHVKEMDD